MGLQLATAVIKVRADGSRLKTDLRGVKRGVTSSMKGIASSIKGIMGPMLAFASIGAGVVAFQRLISSGEDFNRKMRSSLAIMGDVSSMMRGEMRAAAFEAARATQFSASQAAESFFFLASAGLDAQQSIAALPQVAMFAQAGMFDMARATDLATDAQSALGLTVKDAQGNLTNLKRVTDVLVKANTLANASVEQFSQSITTKAGAAARVVGKDIEELTAVLAAFADQGVKGQEAGTAINIVFRDLQTAVRNNKGAFEKHNIAVFDSAGNMRNTANIIGDLEKALAGMSDETKKTTLAQLGFADRSMIFIQTLLGTSEKIARYEKELRKAGGTTKEVADKQLTPFQKVMAQIGARFTKLSSSMISALNPAFTGLARILEGSNKKWNAWMLKAKTATKLVGMFFSSLVVEIKKQWSVLIWGLDFGIKSWAEKFGIQLKPMVESFQKAFKFIVNDLDVMLGSWEGFFDTIDRWAVQTALAFQAVWVTAVANVDTLAKTGPERLVAAHMAADIESRKQGLQTKKKDVFGKLEFVLKGKERKEMKRQLADAEEAYRIFVREQITRPTKVIRDQLEKDLIPIGRQSLERDEESKKKQFGKLSDLFEDVFQELEQGKTKKIIGESIRNILKSAFQFAVGFSSSRAAMEGKQGGAAGKGRKAERVGFTELGNKIQDTLLGGGDPVQNAIEKNTADTAAASRTIAENLAENVGQDIGKSIVGGVNTLMDPTRWRDAFGAAKGVLGMGGKVDRDADLDILLNRQGQAKRNVDFNNLLNRQAAREARGKSFDDVMGLNLGSQIGRNIDFDNLLKKQKEMDNLVAKNTAAGGPLASRLDKLDVSVNKLNIGLT